MKINIEGFATAGKEADIRAIPEFAAGDNTVNVHCLPLILRISMRWMPLCNPRSWSAAVFLLLAAFLLLAPFSPARTEVMEKCDAPIKVLVTGASGYLGQFLLDAAVAQNAETGRRQLDVAGTFTTRPAGIRDDVRALQMDLADAESVKNCLSCFAPDVVINLAAMSAPAACEKNKENAGLFIASRMPSIPSKADAFVLAAAINVPTALLSALKATSPDALLVHVSTDQIFDGDNPVYTGSIPGLATPCVGANTMGRAPVHKW
jgi:hypothetical protein